MSAIAAENMRTGHAHPAIPISPNVIRTETTGPGIERQFSSQNYEQKNPGQRETDGGNDGDNGSR